MRVDEPHFIPVALGNEVPDVADGGDGLARTKPGLHFQLLPALEDGEVEVEMLEVAGELAAGAFRLPPPRS